MGQRTSGAEFTVAMDGLTESLAVLTRAGAKLHDLETGAVYASNSTLRAAAKQLAERVAADTVGPLVAAGPARQSPKMADTIRAKVDRMPVIRIGAVNPALSGFRRGRGANARYRTSLAWGIERGPGPGQPNRYGIPRRAGGHVIGPNLDRIARRVVPEYEPMVRLALEAAGVTNWGT